MKDVTDKVAFVTGGASGLGLGISHALLEAGMKVVISYRREESLHRAKESFTEQQRARARFVRVDVTDRHSMEEAAEAAERAFGRLHVLCNNAGAIMFCSLEEATYEDWEWMINVNLFGVFSGIKHVVPRIKRHGEGGHVVNTCSMSAFISGPRVGLYTASKCAVRGLTECLRYDLAEHDIGVSLLCPGLVRTSIHESSNWRPPYEETGDLNQGALRERLRESFALGMDPADVGRHVVAGISNNSAYIFSHPEFTGEVEGIFREIVAAMPVEEVEAPRLRVEEARRKGTSAAKRRADAIGG